MIFDGELMPGSSHLEADLAERLGMSRTPVREAALQLQAVGLLELWPRHGVRITPISERDMAEVYEILAELEGLSAEKAAEAVAAGASIEALARSLEAIDTALDAENREAWLAADEQFHRQVIALSGNGRMADLFDRYADEVRRAHQVTLWMRPTPGDSHADHRAVYLAIEAGDGATARVRMHAHRKAGSDLITTLLRDRGLRHV